MAWITPKTNWVSTDYINTIDINRITNNLDYLKNKIESLKERIVSLPDKQKISDYPFASKLNAIENALEEINELTYNFNIGETKNYIANGHPFDYVELNRIENATQRIYLTWVIQKENSRHFAYRMGESKFRAVTRIKRADNEPLGYRLDFRLGTTKGVKL